MQFREATEATEGCKFVNPVGGWGAPGESSLVGGIVASGVAALDSMGLSMYVPVTVPSAHA
jgi:hypothetical protein